MPHHVHYVHIHMYHNNIVGNFGEHLILAKWVSLVDLDAKCHRCACIRFKLVSF